jgi:hypothetical protein
MGRESEMIMSRRQSLVLEFDKGNGQAILAGFPALLLSFPQFQGHITGG